MRCDSVLWKSARTRQRIWRRVRFPIVEIESIKLRDSEKLGQPNHRCNSSQSALTWALWVLSSVSHGSVRPATHSSSLERCKHRPLCRSVLLECGIVSEAQLLYGFNDIHMVLRPGFYVVENIYGKKYMYSVLTQFLNIYMVLLSWRSKFLTSRIKSTDQLMHLTHQPPPPWAECSHNLRCMKEEPCSKMVAHRFLWKLLTGPRHKLGSGSIAFLWDRRIAAEAAVEKRTRRREAWLEYCYISQRGRRQDQKVVFRLPSESLLPPPTNGDADHMTDITPLSLYRPNPAWPCPKLSLARPKPEESKRGKQRGRERNASGE